MTVNVPSSAIGATMPENLLLVIAQADGKPIASSLAVYRRGANGGGTLYGRYWGALEHVPCLHFETAYYQLLEFCIEAGLDTFEGGAIDDHRLRALLAAVAGAEATIDLSVPGRP